MKYWAPPTKGYATYKPKVIKALDGGNYIASIKKDGEWERFVKTEDGELYLQGRGISTVTGTHLNKIDHVEHLKDSFNQMPNGSVVLGELYYQEGDSTDVSSILRCKPPKANARQREDYGYLRFYIYDVLAWDGEDYSEKPFDTRWFALSLLSLKDYPYIDFAEFKHIDDYAMAKEFLTEAFENEEEGLVCVRKDKPYMPGKRQAWSSIKMKRESKEMDVVITNVLPPTIAYAGEHIDNWPYWAQSRANGFAKLPLGLQTESSREANPDMIAVSKNFYYDMYSAVEVSAYDNDGNLVFLTRVGSGLNEKNKKAMGKNPASFIGKPAVVTCMEITKDGSLRQPRFIKFRTDIDAEDCTLDKIMGEE